jgi:hypothetical protein
MNSPAECPTSRPVAEVPGIGPRITRQRDAGNGYPRKGPVVLDGVLEREAQLTGQPLELGPNLLRVDLDLALELTRGVRAINSPAALITSHGAQRLARPRPSIDDVDAEQVLAFRLARSGLARRDARSLAEAARCPASDFTRDAALLALAARRDGVSRGWLLQP